MGRISLHVGCENAMLRQAQQTQLEVPRSLGASCPFILKLVLNTHLTI